LELGEDEIRAHGSSRRGQRTRTWYGFKMLAGSRTCRMSCRMSCRMMAIV
jgi:hypothetical protein